MKMIEIVPDKFVLPKLITGYSRHLRVRVSAERESVEEYFHLNLGENGVQLSSNYSPSPLEFTKEQLEKILAQVGLEL